MVSVFEAMLSTGIWMACKINGLWLGLCVGEPMGIQGCTHTHTHQNMVPIPMGLGTFIFLSAGTHGYTHSGYTHDLPMGLGDTNDA